MQTPGYSKSAEWNHNLPEVAWFIRV